MLGLAARVEVNVGVVSRRAGRLNRSVLLLLRQLLKSIVDRLRDKRALFYPALRAAGRADFGEAPLALEDLDPIPVFDDATSC